MLPVNISLHPNIHSKAAMSESEKIQDRLEKLIEQKTAENSALNKILGKLVKDDEDATGKEDNGTNHNVNDSNS